ncbi:CLUMA_CG018947, isoform A [Clunio marinus]|uniref:CLUMA_CG018947, isoform A n=1 Tax=Clunio marinus TaxID=568069 RepID=A0A1J1J1L6_9DIPT|nr:CLUMA_CG018947, isoform A [Clunio marinus]
MNISFENLSYKVEKRKLLGKKDVTEILKDINGEFRSCELSAIMGPSGSGKSTMLNILSGYTSNGFKGTIKVNNNEANPNKIRKKSSYIMQENSLHTFLSVHETINFAMNLKVGSRLNFEQRRGKIHHILESLGLLEIVGNRVKDISGGEQKRLSIALELVDDPSIIFLDEPTTGLDSSSSLQCIQLLKKLAEERKTIVCTIHSPSALLFDLLDHIYVIADSSCIYQGSTKKLIPFLNELNLICPQIYTPSDFLLEIATNDYGPQNHRLTDKIKNGLNNEFRKVENYLVEEDLLLNSTQESTEYSTSFYQQFKILLYRNFLTNSRDKTLFLMRLLINIGVGLCFGIMYFGIGNEASFIYDIQRFIVYSTFHPMFLGFNSQLTTYKKIILNEISGEFRACELSGIVGQSGSGKTSLLNILSGFTKGSVSGSIKINGKDSKNGKFREISKYIMQDFSLHRFITVEESMKFAANLTRCNESEDFKNLKITSILKELSLADKHDHYTSNLSGGEQKRLSIALELIDDPSILYLDEPTTGLDSLSSLQCVQLLRKLAYKGKTIICTIHTPSALLFEMFDYIYALADGNCIYQGSSKNLVPFLKELDLICPPSYNPIDFLLEISNNDYGEQNQRLTDKIENGMNSNYRSRDLHTSKKYEVFNIYLDSLNPDPNPISTRLMSNFTNQLGQLLIRNFLIATRDKTLTLMRLIIHLTIAIFIGIMYNGIGDDASNIFNIYKFLFFNIFLLMFTAFSSLQTSFVLKISLAMVDASLSLQFKDLCYHVDAGHFIKSEERTNILKKVNGEFRSRELTAICGPSGSGKSSLLNALSGYKVNNVTGAISLNAENISTRQIRRFSSYIMQENKLHDHLTVYESMMFAACFKLKNAENKQRKVDRILKSLNMEEKMETFVKKLSGGEKKRLSIAFELVDDPLIMFLDEPTTGLDSSSSTQCIRILKRLANEGKMIICTIHSPSPLIFEMFDHVYTLADGYCIYQGSSKNLLPFLKELNLICPDNYTPSDFLLEIATNDYGNENHRLTNKIKNGMSSMYRETSTTCHQILNNNQINLTSPSNSIYLLSLFQQTKNLLYRNSLISVRDKSLITMRLFIHLITGIIFGILYKNSGSEASKFLDNYRYIVTTIVFQLYTSYFSLQTAIPLNFPILKRERFNRWYSASAYYFAFIIHDLPITFLCSMTYVSITYLMTDQPRELLRFLAFLSISLTLSYASQGLGFMCSALFNAKSSVIFGGMFLAPFFMFSSAVIQMKDAANYFHWLFHANFLDNAIKGTLNAIYGLDRSKIECVDDIYCHYSYPKKVLQEFSIYISIWRVLFVLTLYAIFTRILTFIFIKYRLKK